MRAAIIGKGNIGTAMATVLTASGVTSESWDIKDGERDSFQGVVDPADIIFLCIPSWANREVARNIARQRVSRKKCLVITLAKGLEEETHQTMDQVLAAELRGRADYGILAGPMLAAELQSRHLSVAVMSLSRSVWKKKLKNFFDKSWLHLTFTADQRGVALCSVLKNIYAVGLGIADGLGMGANSKAFFTLQAYQEMKKIVTLLGGQARTVGGPAGFGDLLVTGWSGKSFNFRIGREIAAGVNACPRSEGCLALPSMVRLLGSRRVRQFPALITLTKIIIENQNARKAFSSFYAS